MVTRLAANRSRRGFLPSGLPCRQRDMTLNAPGATAKFMNAFWTVRVLVADVVFVVCVPGTRIHVKGVRRITVCDTVRQY